MKGRIEALDVLRGFTVAMMVLVNNSWNSYSFLKHAKWNGMTPCDMVFPFFLFIMGVSTCLALSRNDFKSDWQTWSHVIKRSVSIILVCWGIQWFAAILGGDFLPFDHLRLTGVLVRIALSYFILCALVLIGVRKYLPGIAVVLLIGYTLLLMYCNGYADDSTNILARVDEAVLGKSHLYRWAEVDPEGILGLIPSVAHAIIGFMCGEVLISSREMPAKLKVMLSFVVTLFVAGLGLLEIAPLNKKVWSPSFVLVTCACAELFLAALIYIIDVKGWKRWTGFFKAFGTNSLLIYALSEVLEIVFGRLGIDDWAHELLRGAIGNVQLADLLYALIFVGINFIIAYILYRKRLVLTEIVKKSKKSSEKFAV